METLLLIWNTIKPLLPILSYLLPCLGFVVFFLKQSALVHKWEERRENGTISLTAEELDDFGTIMQNEVRSAKNDTLLEGTLVVLGAGCGILSLYV